MQQTHDIATCKVYLGDDIGVRMRDEGAFAGVIYNHADGNGAVTKTVAKEAVLGAHAIYVKRDCTNLIKAGGIVDHQVTRPGPCNQHLALCRSLGAYWEALRGKVFQRLKAIAIKPGLEPSRILTCDYAKVSVAAPVIEPVAASSGQWTRRMSACSLKLSDSQSSSISSVHSGAP